MTNQNGSKAKVMNVSKAISKNPLFFQNTPKKIISDVKTG